MATTAPPPWLSRQLPRWLLGLAVCASAITALVQGVSGWARALCWMLLVIDAVAVVGVGAVLVRHGGARGRPSPRGEAGNSAPTVPRPSPRVPRVIAAERTVLGVVFVLGGLDALATATPSSFGATALLFGVQLLVGRRAARP